jgi:hypothetical protein
LASYTRPAAAAGFAAVAISLGSVPALAQPPSAEPAPRSAPRLRLAPGDCGGLDVSETERLLRTELAIVAARAERVRAPVVLVTCAENQVTIRVRDTRSRRTIEDTMPAPPEGQPGRERVIALAASQLFLSSWLDVVLAEERRPRAAPPRAAPRPAPRRRPAPERRAAALRPEVALLAGARVRRVHDALPAAAARLELGLGSRRLGVSVHAAGERTRAAQRGDASVRYDLLGGGAGVELRQPGAVLHWSAGVRLTGYWLRAAADSRDRDLRATSASGSAFEATLGGGPALPLTRAWGLGLDVQAGVLLPEVVAGVDGGSHVALHGAFAGLSLKLSYRAGATR